MEFVVLFKKLFADKLCESNPGLKDIDQATLRKYLQDPKHKLLRDECKQLAGNVLPEIRFNVQDPTVVKKCLQYVVTDLYVSDLSSHMDKDPLLVNFQNGVGYIPTGELMKPHPSHLCSRVASGEYHSKPNGTGSRFREFLLDISNGDLEVVRWKILWMGYCLSRYTDEEIVVFWWGEGGNGKGALKQALLAAWGDYAIICSKHIFIKSKDDSASAASSHLAQLKGIRLAFADELEDGKTIASATIKEQTGGGSISARELFEKVQTFIPIHKLGLLTNNKPHIPVEEVNAGLLRRMVLEAFLNQYVEESEYNPEIPSHRRADVGLKTYLESKEGIKDVTRVCFEGAHEWYKLRTANSRVQKVLWPRSKAFKEACNEYLRKNDTLSSFLEQYCLVKAKEVVVMTELSAAYWLNVPDDHKMTSQAFTKALKSHNITTNRDHPKVPKQNGSGSGRPYVGVRLLTDEELSEKHAIAKKEMHEWQHEEETRKMARC
jgi:P4 family phage/plasmid primase-like protien